MKRYLRWAGPWQRSRGGFRRQCPSSWTPSCWRQVGRQKRGCSPVPGLPRSWATFRSSPRTALHHPREMVRQDSPLVMEWRGSEWGRSFLRAAQLIMAAFANLSFWELSVCLYVSTWLLFSWVSLGLSVALSLLIPTYTGFTFWLHLPYCPSSTCTLYSSPCWRSW